MAGSTELSVAPGRIELDYESEEGHCVHEIDVSADGMTVTLRTELWAKISGRLVDESGAELAGWHILVGRGASLQRQLKQVLTGAGLKTANDGTFEVPRMRAGRQELRFLSGDGSREFVRAVEVDSRSEELGDLEVLPPAALLPAGNALCQTGQ